MLADRRTKIVATIGPAIHGKENLRRAIHSGMNVARLNFSHGNHEGHLQVIQDLRALSEEMHAPITILQDLQGPKIRVGRFENGSIELEDGEKVVITVRDTLGKKGLIPSDFKALPRSSRPGGRIMLDDGLLELRIDSVAGDDVHCTVIYGGTLKDRKGMNVPGGELAVECLTEKDLRDLEFGLQQGVDYIALSFARRGDDIRQLRELIQAKGSQARIVAKIEMLEAIENLEEIVRLSDAVMVARGDLAVEVGQTRLPQIQKQIVSLCNSMGKPVITATQMLDSMTENPRPTRAEITDVANAVLDGSDALMLSAESASGKYPFRCIETMHDIILEVEKNGDYFYDMRMDDQFSSVADAIGAASALTAMKLNATAIVCLTTSGKTATIISGFRPKARIIAVTHIVPTLNRLELVWGIQTLKIDPYDSSDDAMNQIEEMLLQYGLVKPGDRVILTLGVPVLERGTTNALRVYTIGREDVKRCSDDKLPTRCR
ncbi:MAG: pyruvate kinase [Bdellovibrionales bacterium]|jgi:pyruvate kinase|nr:pyruvate kinase [Bdellovibrionales bacterium]